MVVEFQSRGYLPQPEWFDWIGKGKEMSAKVKTLEWMCGERERGSYVYSFATKHLNDTIIVMNVL